MSRPALARTAGILCSRTDFRNFLAERYPHAWAQFGALRDIERAAAVIRALCGIESRSELDSNPAVAQRFHTKLGFPFSAWRRSIK
ncbi:hypothetical protein K2O51_23485 [Cupriavidus pinatubonensis]|uniref:hypothetical protein n=1 Tax=Cupriavidus pinatubonensis TaxID=248026 RepID=UPI001C72F5BD|nr:hypothetical protein [Cupriavidus pinatubonensis]QYY30335.1 hypothetical protein K2O51_23485 [Cupriavidus pinatubonensis]